MPVVVFLLCAAVVGAATTRISGIGPTAFADTESVTNVQLRGMVANAGILEVSLSLTGTPSNSLEIAFGSAGATGEVPFGDEGLSIGWDCGRWFVASPTNRLESAEAIGTAPRTLRLKAIANGDGVPKSWSIVATGAAHGWIPELPPNWAFSRSWTHLRVAMRGTGAEDSALSARVAADGSMMFMR